MLQLLAVAILCAPGATIHVVDKGGNNVVGATVYVVGADTLQRIPPGDEADHFTDHGGLAFYKTLDPAVYVRIKVVVELGDRSIIHDAEAKGGNYDNPIRVVLPGPRPRHPYPES